MDLALNNLEKLICHKPKQTNKKKKINTREWERERGGERILSPFIQFSIEEDKV